MMIITSKENPTIKQVHKLLSAGKYRKREGCFVAEGLRLCRDVALTGGEIRIALMTPSFREGFGEDARFIEEHATLTYTVSDSVFAYLSDTVTPQGVLCVCALPGFLAMPQKPGKYVILENVADPGNLGAISRTAEALGVDGLLLSGGCDVYHPKALRASMGALLRLPVYGGDMPQLLSCMKQLGVPTYAAVVTGYEKGIDQVDFTGPCAVVIGNEAGGITKETADGCDMRVTIPMAGRAESLNAAMAACILVWEMTGRGGAK